MLKIDQILQRIRTLKWKCKYHNKLIMDGMEAFHKNTNLLITENGSVKMGKKISTNSNVHLTACSDGVMTLGDNVSFNRNDIVICRHHITIGNHVAFGPNVLIYDHDHVFTKEGFKSTEYKTGAVIIENDCWIGANVTILRNTHIGEGCIIGAGTVVSGTIPAHSIVKANREISITPIEDR